MIHFSAQSLLVQIPTMLKIVRYNMKVSHKKEQFFLVYYHTKFHNPSTRSMHGCNGGITENSKLKGIWRHND
jgi:hypothetical protein